MQPENRKYTTMGKVPWTFLKEFHLDIPEEFFSYPIEVMKNM